MIRTAISVCTVLAVLNGCTDHEQKKRQDTGKSMKCGAGKCGAQFYDGNSALARKKKNILSQMQENDNRKTCIMKAETTRSLYDCVRDPSTGKLSIKDAMQGPSMKCGAGKCGGDM